MAAEFKAGANPATDFEPDNPNPGLILFIQGVLAPDIFAQGRGLVDAKALIEVLLWMGCCVYRIYRNNHYIRQQVLLRHAFWRFAR